MIEAWADYIAQVQFSEIDRKRCSQHVKDTLSSLICGHYTSEGKQLLQLTLNDRLWAKGHYEDDCLGHVMMTCSLTRLTECDDIHMTSCVTPGSVIIPSILFLSWINKHPTDADVILDAILVGYEAMTRLGEAINGSKVLYRGIWPTYFCAPFGCAAATARLLGMSVEETAHALTYALTLSTGGTNRGKHSAIRWLSLGQAARSGVWAAFLAGQGMKANPASINSEWFRQTFGLDIDVSNLRFEQNNWMINSTSIKPYCSAKQVMPSITGLQKIMTSGLTADEIQQVNIFVPPPFYTMVNQKPYNRLSSLTSVPYQLAVTMFHPQVLYDADRSKIITDLQVETFMDKVRVHIDESLEYLFPERWPTRVEVITSRGIFKDLITSVPGDPDLPLSNEQINRKIHRFLDPLWGKNATTEFIRLNDQSALDRRLFPRLIDFIQHFHFQMVGNQ